MADPTPDKVTAYLAEVKRDLTDGAVYPHRVMEQHGPRLLAAVEAVLELHGPAGWDSSRCEGCPDECLYCEGEHQWPCPTYRAISRALLGEGP